MRTDAIKIGTSGWKFDDWAGNFYPLRVPRTKWLEYYAARFPIGEINSTYYRIAPPRAFDGINKHTPEGFGFFAKVHADVTHARTKPWESMSQLLSSLRPLQDSGKLLGLLAQFPASFRCEDANVNYLRDLSAMAADVPLFVEFRHKTWNHANATDGIRDLSLSWVSVDEPSLPDLMPFGLIASRDTLYLRLHGRNAAAWYDKAAGDRYDYDYSAEELTDIGKQLLSANPRVRRAFVFFNNCYHGQAPRNAQWLMTWLAEQVATSDLET
jgi:uncharacterized protein YecE (DUF72 family)